MLLTLKEEAAALEDGNVKVASFTKDDIYYYINICNNEVVSCSCPDYYSKKTCRRHMQLVNRIEGASLMTKGQKSLPESRGDIVVSIDSVTEDLTRQESKRAMDETAELDLLKDKILQAQMLKLWDKKVNSNLIIEKMEAITCQWEGLKLTIYATKYLPNKRLISYNEGSFTMPKDDTHCASFSVLLATMLCLKRLVHLNYCKLNLILGSKCKYSIEMMLFDHNDDTLFNSQSTDKTEEQVEEPVRMEKELEEEILFDLDNIKLDEDVVTCEDWEQFIMCKLSNKRKRS